MITFMFVDIVWKFMKKVITPAHHVVSFKIFCDREELYENVYHPVIQKKHLTSN